MLPSLSVVAAAFLLLLLLSSVYGDTKDATYDTDCGVCHGDPRWCGSPSSGRWLSYCGEGVFPQRLFNRTTEYSMCCDNYSVNNDTSNTWECRPFSGNDSLGQVIISGYQCYRPTPAYTALKLTLLVIVLVVVFVCVSPCVLICLCCYCCGRCRRRRESVPTALINVTPSWMLQSPHPAANPYYQMT
jgi:hypothetical protein